jgi:hypothetical protein
MKFTSRDWFWFTLLIGFAFFWWQDRQTLIRHHEWDLEAQRVGGEIRDNIVKQLAKQASQALREKFSGKPATPNSSAESSSDVELEPNN